MVCKLGFSHIENLTDSMIYLVGLLHDIGHGPFSHLFERGFLPQVQGGSKWCMFLSAFYEYNLHFYTR